MATKTAQPLYVRNFRPNRVILKYAGLRHVLEFRGARDDNIALPPEARQNSDVSRMIQNGVLEEIAQEDFLRLASRQVFQTRPDPTIPPANVRGRIGTGVPISKEDSAKPHIGAEADFKKAAVLDVKYAGEVVSTKEELDILEEQGAMDKQKSSYPSKHRDDGAQFNMR